MVQTPVLIIQKQCINSGKCWLLLLHSHTTILCFCSSVGIHTFCSQSFLHVSFSTESKCSEVRPQAKWGHTRENQTTSKESPHIEKPCHEFSESTCSKVTPQVNWFQVCQPVPQKMQVLLFWDTGQNVACIHTQSCVKSHMTLCEHTQSCVKSHIGMKSNIILCEITRFQALLKKFSQQSPRLAKTRHEWSKSTCDKVMLWVKWVCCSAKSHNEQSESSTTKPLHGKSMMWEMQDLIFGIAHSDHCPKIALSHTESCEKSLFESDFPEIVWNKHGPRSTWQSKMTSTIVTMSKQTWPGVQKFAEMCIVPQGMSCKNLTNELL